MSSREHDELCFSPSGPRLLELAARAASCNPQLPLTPRTAKATARMPASCNPQHQLTPRAALPAATTRITASRSRPRWRRRRARIGKQFTRGAFCPKLLPALMRACRLWTAEHVLHWMSSVPAFKDFGPALLDEKIDGKELVLADWQALITILNCSSGSALMSLTSAELKDMFIPTGIRNALRLKFEGALRVCNLEWLIDSWLICRGLLHVLATLEGARRLCSGRRTSETPCIVG